MKQPRISSGSTINHQYRFLYYLANELAYNAIHDPYEINSYRYSIGTVIMSFTTIEVYFNHIFFSDEYGLQSVHAKMSKELAGKIEKLSLPEKIELSLNLYPKANPEYLRKDREPYQSFDLIRQLRNHLVHYSPEKETFTWSDQGERVDIVKILEKRLQGKYEFLPSHEVPRGNFSKSFLVRLFNKNCARWAFLTIEPFITALAASFQITPYNLRREWDLDEKNSLAQ